MLRTAAIALAATVAFSAPALAGGKVCHGCYKPSHSATSEDVVKVQKHTVNVHVKHVRVVNVHHSYEVHQNVTHGPVKHHKTVSGHAPKRCYW